MDRYLIRGSKVGSCYISPKNGINTNYRIIKTKKTNNVGIVGRLKEPTKNIGGTEIALKSNANKLHLWGSDKIKSDNSRVIVHSWEKNKIKIYNSFDILINMSYFKEESFGRVIIEALSGIDSYLK